MTLGLAYVVQESGDSEFGDVADVCKYLYRMCPYIVYMVRCILRETVKLAQLRDDSEKYILVIRKDFFCA